MREDESNWFTKWEEQLPSPDELMPLSQTLITPHLALAFHINSNPASTIPPIQPQNSPPQPPPLPPFQSPNSGEFDSSAGDEPARTLKRPRLVWTPQLHKRFVDAVAHLGIKNAVPKTIMQLMSVDGLTRENVASHLQKYRLYLKRMQQGNLSSHGSSGDTATDHLFASSPVPAHFLHQGRSNSEHFVPFVAVPVMQQQQYQQQMAVQYRQVSPHFGSPPNEHPFLARQQQQQQQVHRMAMPVHNSVASSYIDDLESPNARKVLTLFPTGND
ncbi:transcription factor MYBC1-like [Apium graveolens]|uniref:transcription factor MYBC1-like n=1 Tax=Apium graveolens TaxID=4045 RepID=UPI003D7ADA48